jgi:hypothetical protein
VIEILKDILPKLGIPSVLVTIIYIFFMLNPITSISASSIELRLATKEKRFYIKVIRSILEILFYLTLLMVITESFFASKSIYNSILAIIFTIILIGIFVWIMIMDLMGKVFMDIFKKYHKGFQILFYLLFLFYFLMWFVLPAYYIGPQIYSDIHNKTLSDSEQIGVFFSVLIFYFIMIVAIYNPIIKTLYKFLGFNMDDQKNLTVEIDGKMWYLFHPVDTDRFLLGNKALIRQCTEFSFVEKTELLKRVLIIDKVNE